MNHRFITGGGFGVIALLVKLVGLIERGGSRLRARTANRAGDDQSADDPAKPAELGAADRRPRCPAATRQRPAVRGSIGRRKTPELPPAFHAFKVCFKVCRSRRTDSARGISAASSWLDLCGA